MMDDFDTLEVPTGETTIFLRRSGSGPPLLLLHGFPETHLMWRDVAPQLGRDFTVVCPDLRGYGHSGCPPSTPDHAPYAKRAMAADMTAVMASFGYRRFSVAGHDRGGRVAYRLALDHGECVQRLAVLDIIPTLEVWDRTDAKLALAFWPWCLMAQPAPLPERLISAAPEAVIADALDGWGSAPGVFDPAIRNAYAEPLRDPARVHAICEEYRAAAALDPQHDREDLKLPRRIACPVLALWSAGGALDTWYAAEGGPLAIWRRWAGDVRGWPVAGGHFFPEALPDLTAEALRQFFLGGHDAA